MKTKKDIGEEITQLDTQITKLAGEISVLTKQRNQLLFRRKKLAELFNV